MKIKIVARKSSDSTLDHHPLPRRINGRPFNFVVNVCIVCRICLGYFAWLNMPSFYKQTDALIVYNVFYFRVGSTSISHARHVKTRKDNDLRIWIFSQKLPFPVEKKYQRQEVQYTIPIRHITNISDFVLFQRSCGSMKSVSSFSSIDC